MKSRIAFTFMLVIFLFSTQYSQYSINSILLPDNNGGMPSGIFCCEYNQENNCVYLGGSGFVFVIDGVTDQTIARIPVPGRVTKMKFIPGENKLICAQNDLITIINCAANTVIKTIDVADAEVVKPAYVEYNPVNKRVYSLYWPSAGDSLDVCVVIDVEQDSLITKIFLPEKYGHTGWNASDSLLWWVRGNRIRRYDCNTNTLKDSMWIDNVNLSYMTFNELNKKAYICDGNGRVLIKDSSSVIFCNVGTSPAGLVWNPAENKIYCANAGSIDISVIDGVANNVIKTIPASLPPLNLYCNPAGNKVYCVQSGFPIGMISIINSSSDSVAATLPLTYVSNDPSEIDLCINNLNHKIYFPVDIYNRLIIIDDNNNVVLKELTLGANSYAMSWNNAYNKLFSIIYSTYYDPQNLSSSEADGYLAVINGAGLLPGAIPVGKNPLGIAQNTFYNTIYCVNAGSNNISVIDAGTNQVINTIPVGGRPKSVLWNPAVNKIYTANYDSGTVTIINGATNTRLATAAAGSKLFLLALNSTNNKIYCGSEFQDTIAVIDGFTNMITKKIKTGNYPDILIWNSAGNKIYSVDKSGAGRVNIIDGVVDTLITSHPISYAGNLTCNTTDNKVYCSALYDGIIIIDGSTNQITDTLQFGSSITTGPVYWHSIENRLYCMGFDNSTYDGRLYVVNGTTDSLLFTVPLGKTYLPYHYVNSFAADLQNGRIFLGDGYSRILVIKPNTTGVISEKDKAAPRFSLEQNYPNPFNPSTSIKFEVPVESDVTLKIFNILGEEVVQLFSDKSEPGIHTVEWDGSKYPSGVYIYRLKAGDFIKTKKMILIK